MNATAIRSQMIEMTEARETEQLFSDLAVLEEQMEGNGTAEQRMVAAMISDIIEKRHGLGPAMDVIFEDIDYAGTYREALELAYVATVK